MTKSIKVVTLVGTSLVSGAITTHAAVVDLTTAGSSGTINGAIFETTTVRPTGTGVIRPFLRVQANGEEQGYNTSGRPVAFDELTDPNFTRDLSLMELAVTTINSTPYFEFLLDINEPNGGGQNLLSLDRMQVSTSPTASQTTNVIATLGTLRYDLDAGADNHVLMDYDLASGSGSGDVRFFIPTAAFAAAQATDFLYMFVRFGDTESSGDGFEEIAALSNGTNIIPLPTAAGLAMAAFAGVGLRRRRR